MKIYFLIILLCIIGCKERTSSQIKADQEASKINTERIFKNLITVVEYEGHEYLWYSGNQGQSVCHKANCKYCENKE